MITHSIKNAVSAAQFQMRKSATEERKEHSSLTQPNEFDASSTKTPLKIDLLRKLLI